MTNENVPEDTTPQPNRVQNPQPEDWFLIAYDGDGDSHIIDGHGETYCGLPLETYGRRWILNRVHCESCRVAKKYWTDQLGALHPELGHGR